VSVFVVEDENLKHAEGLDIIIRNLRAVMTEGAIGKMGYIEEDCKRR